MFRLEQPHLNANASFFEALSCCSRLQRFCLISRSGTFDPSAVETFMERCSHVTMCHMFMGGTLVACRTLQKALQEKFSVERSALNVVIYPLQHEDLPSVIRDIPLTLLDRITLFQSHVAQPPHLSPWWLRRKAPVWLVLNSWGAETVFSAGNKIHNWKTDWLIFIYSVISSFVISCINNCFRLYNNTWKMLVYFYMTQWCRSSKGNLLLLTWTGQRSVSATDECSLVGGDL